MHDWDVSWPNFHLKVARNFVLQNQQNSRFQLPGAGNFALNFYPTHSFYSCYRVAVSKIQILGLYRIEWLDTSIILSICFLLLNSMSPMILGKLEFCIENTGRINKKVCH